MNIARHPRSYGVATCTTCSGNDATNHVKQSKLRSVKIITCRTSQRQATASTIYTIVLHSGPRNVVITKPFYGSVFTLVMYLIYFRKQTTGLCHIPDIITFTP